MQPEEHSVEHFCGKIIVLDSIQFGMRCACLPIQMHTNYKYNVTCSRISQPNQADRIFPMQGKMFLIQFVSREANTQSIFDSFVLHIINAHSLIQKVLE